MATNHVAPKNWKYSLDKIKEMRIQRVAPVDSMGCHKCFDSNADPKIQRFQILVSLILSSQTKDEYTFAAMDRLKNYGLTIKSMMDIDPTQLHSLIYPVGFYKKKSNFIKKVSGILHEKYDDDIPKCVDDILSLPGVGPKMAYILMNVAWNEVIGIGVDTHIHRICKRISWVPSDSRSPWHTQKYLTSWLPKEHWKDLNEIFVGFGQQICTPTRPRCRTCLLSNACPSSTYKESIL